MDEQDSRPGSFAFGGEDDPMKRRAVGGVGIELDRFGGG